MPREHFAVVTEDERNLFVHINLYQRATKIKQLCVCNIYVSCLIFRDLGSQLNYDFQVFILL